MVGDNSDVTSGLVVDIGCGEDDMAAEVVAGAAMSVEVVGDCRRNSSSVGFAVSEIVVLWEGCASSAAVVAAAEV